MINFCGRNFCFDKLAFAEWAPVPPQMHAAPNSKSLVVLQKSDSQYLKASMMQKKIV